jgi:allantoin racemase
MSRICYLGTEDRRAFLQSKAAPGFEIGNIDRKDGPQTIESMYEEYLYIPIMIESVVQAEKEGYQAVITGCAGDPGLDGARELVRIPVTGPGESGMILANMLGFRFSVITILDSVVRSTYELAHKVGVSQKLASVKAIGVPVLEVRKREQSTYDALKRSAVEAIEKDHADVLVMGCASLSFYSEWLQAEMKIPVVNPLVAALKMAEVLVSMNLTYSPLTYQTPPKIAAGLMSAPCCRG